MAASYLSLCYFFILLCASVLSSEPPPRVQASRLDFTPTPSVDCSSFPQSSFLFCHAGEDPMHRAEDLVSRLTLEEVIGQTSSIAPAIPRLGIRDYNWRSNCLHGWSKSGGVWNKDLKWTVFPAPIGLGATFNVHLIRSVGDVTATEGRALHNEMLMSHHGSSTEAAGLNCFSPNVNLFRDPRWGRGQETFGEDPFLISMIGAAYTLGLQEGEGGDDRYLKVAACAKHYAVHSGPEETREKLAANVSLHDLYDTYLPAFKSQFMGAKVAQVMPAYSGLNCSKQADSAPDAANPFLLKTVLRGEFSAPNISVCSDNGGISLVNSGHHYVSSDVMAAAVCMNAGTDLDLGTDLVYTKNLGAALEQGLVALDTIKLSVIRNFHLRMRLGDFDAPSRVPYQRIDKASLDTGYNQAINLQAARESIVLLKKTGLPIRSGGIKRIAVIGPNANNSQVMLSSYEGIPSKVVNVLEGVLAHFSNTDTVVEYAQGCDVLCANKTRFQDAQYQARRADHVVMVMGLSDALEGENHDRLQTTCEGREVPLLGLPGCQSDLVESIADINGNVIVVLINGGPLGILNLHKNPGVVGIIEAFYPGALGGVAVAGVLFGEYNPGGKMPVSVFQSVDELPPVDSYDMSAFPGRTHRYSMLKPLYPFGYGLSYSEYVYYNLTLSSKVVAPCNNVTVSVLVANVSPTWSGDEVVLLFLLPDRNAHPFFPRNVLVGFTRIHLASDSQQKVSFVVNPYMMSLVGPDGVQYVYPGQYFVQIEKLVAPMTISGAAPVKTTKCTGSPQCMAC